MKTSIYNLTFIDLENLLIANNFKKYNAKQIFNWIYKKHVQSFFDMTNIKKELQFFLDDRYFFNKVIERKRSIDKTDDTTKFLIEFDDKNCVELVILKFYYGFSVCISSQVGCSMGCKFCASGLLKKVRNLEVSEMSLQILFAQNYIQEHFNNRLSHVVVMGTGEPFDNFDNLIKFLNILTDSNGFEIGSRKVTVSTCGIVKRIYDWTNLNLQINLAISLHAPNDSLRSMLMPINKIYPLNELMKAINYYLEHSKRRLTIEYILIDDVNDSYEHAMELISLFKNKLCYINIIPYNEHNLKNNFRRSRKIKIFYDILKKGKLIPTIRQEKGLNINAACGQLQAKQKGICNE